MTNIFYEDRNDIPAEYTWDLNAIYNSEDEWLEDINESIEIATKLSEYKDRVGESKESLLEVFELQIALNRKITKTYSYANMFLDQDTRNSKAQELKDKIMQTIVKSSELTSFIVPEMLEIDSDILKKYIDESQELKLYEHSIMETLRQKEHFLSPKEESLLAQVGEVTGASQQTFSMLSNADLRFPKIKNENGEEVELTQGNFVPFLRNKDRKVRETAYNEFYDTYGSFKNTFAQTLSGNVKKNIFNARVRNYNSSIEAALDNNNIPVKVYENLIESVHDNLDAMHKYISIRKRALKLDKLKYYDLYTPIIDNYEFNIPYEEGKALMVEGLQPLGKEYLDAVDEGLRDRWIDVYENSGKRSGAYSGGAYDTKPYILLNYQNEIDSVFTLAHEMGHSIHSYLTRKYQEPIYGNYCIFVAEVASTCNEALLLNHMLKNYKSEEEKLFLLNHYLESFRGTVFRQTMFAEFEKIIYEYAENGGALTADYLSETYKELNLKYYGEEIEVDERIATEWARIPHFYYNYYVFQYATGFSAAIALSQNILNEGEVAVERYLNFLKSGSSDYPINVLQKAGVDMMTKEPVDNALKIFRDLVDEMDELIK